MDLVFTKYTSNPPNILKNVKNLSKMLDLSGLILIFHTFSAVALIKRRIHHAEKRFDLSVDNHSNHEDLDNVTGNDCDAYLASGSYNGTLAIWNLSTRVCIKSIKAHSPHRLSALAASTDGLTLVSVGSDCKIHVSCN